MMAQLGHERSARERERAENEANHPNYDEASTKKVEELKNKIMILETENESLAETVSKQKDTITKLDDLVKGFARETGVLQKQPSHVKGENGAMRKRIGEMEQDLADIEKEKDEIAEELENVRKDDTSNRGSLTTSLADLQQKLEEERKQLA